MGLNEERLQIALAKMERELLALKTAKKVAPLIQSYTKEYTETAWNSRLKITYGDGTQPIISEVFRTNSTGVAILSTPSGNTQYVFSYGRVAGTVKVVSTRPIIGIEPA